MDDSGALGAILTFPTRQWMVSTTLLALFAPVPMACVPDPRAAQEQTVAAIEQSGGSVTRDLQAEGHPITKVVLDGKPVADAKLRDLNGLAELRDLILRQTHITDAGLVHLGTMGQLRVLDLDDNRVSDTGLMHLGALTSLRGLYLAGCEVTDAGLTHLRP